MQTVAIERELRSFIEECFLFGREDTFTDQDSFLDHGIIDSTGILELMAFLQETYGVQVEDEEATPDNLDSIELIAAYLRRKLNGSAWSVSKAEGEAEI